MSRPPVLRALAVAVALGLAGCGDETGSLPAGTFAGSTADRRALTLDISGREIKVNQKKARLLANGTVEATRLPGKPTLKCRAQAKGEELRCVLKVGQSTETVELMRV